MREDVAGRGPVQPLERDRHHSMMPRLCRILAFGQPASHCTFVPLLILVMGEIDKEVGMEEPEIAKLSTIRTARFDLATLGA